MYAWVMETADWIELTLHLFLKQPCKELKEGLDITLKLYQLVIQNTSYPIASMHPCL